MSGLGPTDVDVCEFYDPFSFEIIRQFEAFGFCAEGEGGDFVMDGTIEPGRPVPDHHRRGPHVVQPRRRDRAAAAAGRSEACSSCGASARPCRSTDAEVALCSGGGAGALFTDVLLLGRDQP